MHNDKNNCYKCTERYVGCHGKCEKYASYRAEIEDKKENKLDLYNQYKRERFIKRNELRIKAGEVGLGRISLF